MTDALVLAIDAGGTAVKVCLFDAGGAIRASANADVATLHHPDGRVERDADAFWAATARTIRSVVGMAGGGRIVSAACTGFGNGIFTVDDKGRPAGPGIVSVDHRAQPLVDRLGREGRLDALGAMNGNRLWGGQTVMQIAWLGETDPAAFAAVRWFLPCKDFLRLRLTGEAATDPTDAGGGGLMDLDAGTYSGALFAALGQPGIADRLPPILASSAVAGRVTASAAAETGLPEGLPVATGMMDVAACALGTGVTGPDRMVMIAGTWAIIGLEVEATRAGSPPILNMLHRDGAARLIAEGSPSSAANLGWFVGKGLAGGIDTAEAVALAGASPVVARRCHFLPYVQGPLPRQGAFVGLTAGDDRASMLRAVCEGVAFQHRRHAEDAVRQADGVWPEAIRLAGGAARSAAWARIFADICGRPVEVVTADEVGALGAAICGAVAGGLHADLSAAAARMCRVGTRHEPDPAHADFYAGRYQEFLRLDRGLLDLATHVA